MDYQVRYVGGHVEIYDKRGNFICSADTEQEARVDMRDEVA